jgi:hypothetical protein
LLDRSLNELATDFDENRLLNRLLNACFLVVSNNYNKKKQIGKVHFSYIISLLANKTNLTHGFWFL